MYFNFIEVAMSFMKFFYIEMFQIYGSMFTSILQENSATNFTYVIQFLKNC